MLQGEATGDEQFGEVRLTRLDCAIDMQIPLDPSVLTRLSSSRTHTLKHTLTCRRYISSGSVIEEPRPVGAESSTSQADLTRTRAGPALPPAPPAAGGAVSAAGAACLGAAGGVEGSCTAAAAAAAARAAAAAVGRARCVVDGAGVEVALGPPSSNCTASTRVEGARYLKPWPTASLARSSLPAASAQALISPTPVEGQGQARVRHVGAHKAKPHSGVCPAHSPTHL
jgi:hypothetical protein